VFARGSAPLYLCCVQTSGSSQALPYFLEILAPTSLAWQLLQPRCFVCFIHISFLPSLLQFSTLVSKIPEVKALTPILMSQKSKLESPNMFHTLILIRSKKPRESLKLWFRFLPKICNSPHYIPISHILTRPGNLRP